MEYEGVKLEQDDGIAIITLNRPEKFNAFTMKMLIVEFPKLFRELQEDDNVRVVIITGAGKAFCSGSDLTAYDSVDQFNSQITRHERLQPIGAFILQLYNLEKPVLAAVNGMAAGAGASIALLSDIRIASENARFNLSFLSIGAVPDCAAAFILPRLIGAGKTYELIYTGDIIDAREAERIGLVNKVVPHEKLLEETVALAKRLTKAPPLSLAQAKRVIQNGFINNLEQQLYFETYAQNFVLGTEDVTEGARAFIEKRQPNFKGR